MLLPCLLLLYSVFIAITTISAASLPNIIWLQSDSFSGPLLDPASPYNDVLLVHGFRARMVAGGVTFRRHYVTSPECVPSRTSMLTSRYVSDTRTANNGQGIARSTKTGALDESCVAAWSAAQCSAFAEEQRVNETLLDIVARAGYRMKLFGRFDAGAGILQDYGGDASGAGFHGGPDIATQARGANILGASRVDPLKSSWDADPDPFPEDAAVVANAIAWLRADAAERDVAASAPAPFFLWAGNYGPHGPYHTNASWLTLVNVSAAPQLVIPAFSAMHPFDQYQSITKNTSRDYSTTELNSIRACYWGAAAQALSLFEELLDVANRTGHLDNTVVFYSSDHGENSMQWRMDDKNSMREPSLRVPLLITPFRVPGMAPSARVIADVTSHMDILPTIAALVGAPVPAYAKGRSLVPYLATTAPARAYSDAATRAVVAEYHSNLANTGSFAIVTGDFKLITFGNSQPWFNATAYHPILYNVSGDPHETIDLSAAHPDVVASLTVLLEDELGGPGSLARIDSERLASDLALYKTWYRERLARPRLLATFEENWPDVSELEIKARVEQWTGQPWE